MVFYHNICMENFYYLDNAATTKVFEEVFDLMKQNNDELFYNPSASYSKALSAKKVLNDARKQISNLLKATAGKFYFTSSATESNNTVFEGVHLRVGDEVLISKGEHPSVYNAAHRLEKKGIIVKDIDLTENGLVDENHLSSLLSDKVKLVSIIHVSNETGAINDIKRLVKLVKAFNSKIIFHSDGVQAFGKIKVNLQDLGVDLYTVSAHKIYAPRGIAGLYVKTGVVIDSFIVGGGQEDNFRSSTENVAGAIAFAYSVSKVVSEIDKNFDKVLSLKNEFLNKLKNSSINEFLKINSNETNSPYILSISFSKIKGEVLMYALEQDKIYISTGSACSSKKAGNRILEAMGVSQDDVVGSVRVSFSPYFEYDLDYIVESFEKNVLRFEKNVNIKK